MSTQLYFNPFIPAFSNTGVAIGGAQLHFFITGTLTRVDIFSDAGMQVPLPNPVIADISGKYPDIYLDETILYRVRQLDSNGNTIGDDIDPYIPGSTGSEEAQEARIAAEAAAAGAIAAQNNAAAQVPLAANQVTLAANEANSAGTAADRAEAARDSAIVDSNVYATVAEGRAAVADGETFLVEAAGDGFADLHRRTDASNSVFIKTYASQADLENALTSLNAAAANATNILRQNSFNPDFNETGQVVATNVGQGRGGFLTFIDWADIESDFIDAVSSRIGVASTATQMRITVISRNLDDGDANAQFPQSSDTVLSTDIVSDIDIATTVSSMVEPLPITRAARPSGNFALGIKFEALDVNGNNVDIGHRVGRFETYLQRRAGFRFDTATTSTYSNENPIQAPTIALYFQKTETDIINKVEDADSFNDNMKATLSLMNARNSTSILALCGALRPNINVSTLIGDSLTEQTQAAGQDPDAISSAIVDVITDGTVNNFGIGGQTAQQITDRVVNAGNSTSDNFMSADDRAGNVSLQMGTNDLGTSKTSAQILSNFADCANVLTGQFIFKSPTSANGIISSNSTAKARDVAKELIDTYPDKAVDMHLMWARYAENIANDGDHRRGHFPTHLHFSATDTTHPNASGASIQGYEEAAWFCAMAGYGSYVHDDDVGFLIAADSVVHTVRKLGTDGSFYIVGGNDGSFTINPTTGVIMRTSIDVKRDYYELYVARYGKHGAGRIGRIILRRKSDSTVPNIGVSLAGNGQSTLTASSNTIFPTGKQMSIIMRARLKPDVGGVIIGGGQPFMSMSRDRIFFQPRFESGSTPTLTLEAQSAYQYQNYLIWLDAENGTLKGQAGDGPIVSLTPQNANLRWDFITTLFTNNGGDSSPLKNFDIQFIQISDEFLDFENQTVKDRFINSVTGEINDMADPTFGGANGQPWAMFYGDLFDWSGNNRGISGDWFAPIPVGPDHLGFVKVD